MSSCALHSSATGGPAKGVDSQEPHLRTLLGFMGITDVTFVRAERLAFGPDAREQAIAAARTQLGQAVVESDYRQAA
jgi:FMN-dependent NADH-azoreductase